MRLVEFSLAHRIPVACFSCHKINKISISWLNYNRKQEILLKNLPQNQSNLKANGIYSCTGIYFFKSALLYIHQHQNHKHFWYIFKQKKYRIPLFNLRLSGTFMTKLKMGLEPTTPSLRVKCSTN